MCQYELRVRKTLSESLRITAVTYIVDDNWQGHLLTSVQGIMKWHDMIVHPTSPPSPGPGTAFSLPFVSQSYIQEWNSVFNILRELAL